MTAKNTAAIKAANQNDENQGIIERYNDSLLRGMMNWLSAGGYGSQFEYIREALIKNKLV